RTTFRLSIRRKPAGPGTASRPIDTALVAVVAGRSDVNVADARVAERLPCRRRHDGGSHDLPRTIDDPIVGAVAANEIRFALEEHARRGLAILVAPAAVGVQENWPLLGIGLRRREGAVGQNQVRLP